MQAVNTSLSRHYSLARLITPSWDCDTLLHPQCASHRERQATTAVNSGTLSKANPLLIGLGEAKISFPRRDPRPLVAPRSHKTSHALMKGHALGNGLVQHIFSPPARRSPSYALRALFRRDAGLKMLSAKQRRLSYSHNRGFDDPSASARRATKRSSPGRVLSESRRPAGPNKRSCLRPVRLLVLRRSFASHSALLIQ